MCVVFIATIMPSLQDLADARGKREERREGVWVCLHSYKESKVDNQQFSTKSLYMFFADIKRLQRKLNRQYISYLFVQRLELKINSIF